PDFARIVVADGDAGARPRPDEEQRRLDVALDEVAVLAGELGHSGRDDDAVQLLELHEAGEQRTQLVAGAVALGGDPPVLAQALPFEEPDDSLGVAYVNGQQHGGGAGAYDLEVVVARQGLADLLRQ